MNCLYKKELFIKVENYRINHHTQFCSGSYDLLMKRSSSVVAILEYNNKFMIMAENQLHENYVWQGF